MSKATHLPLECWASLQTPCFDNREWSVYANVQPSSAKAACRFARQRGHVQGQKERNNRTAVAYQYLYRLQQQYKHISSCLVCGLCGGGREGGGGDHEDRLSSVMWDRTVRSVASLQTLRGNVSSFTLRIKVADSSETSVTGCQTSYSWRTREPIDLQGFIHTGVNFLFILKA